MSAIISTRTFKLAAMANIPMPAPIIGREVTIRVPRRGTYDVLVVRGEVWHVWPAFSRRRREMRRCGLRHRLSELALAAAAGAEEV